MINPFVVAFGRYVKIVAQEVDGLGSVLLSRGVASRLGSLGSSSASDERVPFDTIMSSHATLQLYGSDPFRWEILTHSV